MKIFSWCLLLLSVVIPVMASNKSNPDEDFDKLIKRAEKQQKEETQRALEDSKRIEALKKEISDKDDDRPRNERSKK